MTIIIETSKERASIKLIIILFKVLSNREISNLSIIILSIAIIIELKAKG